MSLSPWDLSGQLSFNFDLYRPRRPSYVFATRASRQRNESYRHATRSDNTQQDFIEGMQNKKTRKDSYKAATKEEYQLQNLTGPSGRPPIRGGSGNPRGGFMSNYGRQHRRNLSNHFENLPDIPELKESRSKGSLDKSLSVDSRDGLEMTSKPGESSNNARRQSSVARVLQSDFQSKKNLIMLSVSFLLVFTAFRAIQNLQSSLNSKHKLGVIAMGCVHGTMFLTCLFAPVLINKLTAKWTIVLGLLFYLFWIAANFYPHFYTLIPTSIGVGFGQSLAWGAQVTYVQKLAVDYAHISKEITQQQLFKFNGIFLALFQTSHIWGNLVSSLMLSSDVFDSLKDVEIIAGASQSCGMYDTCEEDVPSIWNSSADGVPTAASSLVLKLMGAYLAFAFTGFVLILVFLEKIGAKIDPEKTCLEVVWTNVGMLVNHKLYRMLTPLLIFNGFEQGFIYADYTKSYVTCTIGIEYVGYNMITMGVVNSIFSVLVGLVSRHLPREAIIGIGAVLQVGLLVFLLAWMPDKSLVGVFFVISALWGVCDAVWQTQCNYLVNLCCTDPSEHDVAFQNFRMLQGFGAASAFFLGSFICVSVKLYILISMLVLSILCYVVVEIQLKKMEYGEDGAMEERDHMNGSNGNDLMVNNSGGSVAVATQENCKEDVRRIEEKLTTTTTTEDNKEKCILNIQFKH